MRALILLIFINVLAVSDSKDVSAFGNNNSCQVNLSKEVSSCAQDLLHPFQSILDLQEGSLKKVESLLANKEFQAVVADLQDKIPTLQNSPPIRGQVQGDLLIFVSFSMGEKALINIAEEAKRYGATLVLRGFKEGNYKKTVLALQKIINKTSQGFIIDPELYTLFAIQAVPTLILTRPYELNAAERTQTMPSGVRPGGPLHDKLQGHVSLPYALESFAKDGDLKDVALTFLERGKTL